MAGKLALMSPTSRSMSPDVATIAKPASPRLRTINATCRNCAKLHPRTAIHPFPRAEAYHTTSHLPRPCPRAYGRETPGDLRLHAEQQSARGSQRSTNKSKPMGQRPISLRRQTRSSRPAQTGIEQTWLSPIFSAVNVGMVYKTHLAGRINCVPNY